MVNEYDPTLGYATGESEAEIVERIIQKYRAQQELTPEENKQLDNPSILQKVTDGIKQVASSAGEFVQEHMSGDVYDIPGPRPRIESPTTPMAEEGFYRGLQTVTRRRPRGGMIPQGTTHESVYYRRRGYLYLPKVQRPPRMIPFCGVPVNSFRDGRRSRPFKPHMARLPQRRRRW